MLTSAVAWFVAGQAIKMASPMFGSAAEFFVKSLLPNKTFFQQGLNFVARKNAFVLACMLVYNNSDTVAKLSYAGIKNIYNWYTGKSEKKSDDANTAEKTKKGNSKDQKDAELTKEEEKIFNDLLAYIDNPKTSEKLEKDNTIEFKDIKLEDVKFKLSKEDKELLEDVLGSSGAAEKVEKYNPIEIEDLKSIEEDKSLEEDLTSTATNGNGLSKEILNQYSAKVDLEGIDKKLEKNTDILNNIRIKEEEFKFDSANLNNDMIKKMIEERSKKKKSSYFKFW